MAWKTIERPGYLGKKRDEVQRSWDERFGVGNWKIAWVWSGLVLDRPEALQLYEDGYYEFLKFSSRTLKWLVRTASDVYDTAPSNVSAGFSYDIQETINNHIHDVAIRRAVFRNGVWFEGSQLIQVRGKGSDGESLSPHLVPFHRHDLILDANIRDYGGKGLWWRQLGIPKSIEEFYQHNKVLQIRE